MRKPAWSYEYIEWVDHADPPGSTWFTHSDLTKVKAPPTIQQVGWICKETDVFILVTSSRCDQFSFVGQPTLVLKNCITKRVTQELTK